MIVDTHQCKGARESCARAEAEERSEEQQNCEAFGGEGHGVSIGAVWVEPMDEKEARWNDVCRF